MDGRDVHYIPAKILYNWDFNRYPVSKWASKFLFDTEYVRFYDLEVSFMTGADTTKLQNSLFHPSASQPKCVQRSGRAPIDAIVSPTIKIPKGIPTPMSHQTIPREFKLPICLFRFRTNRLVFAERFLEHR